MKRPALCLVACVVACAPLAGWLTARGQESKSVSRSELMRKKLDHAKGVLEGLATEDFTLVARNAKALKALLDSPEWTTPALRDAQGYPALLNDFRRALDDLSRKAEARNIDGATLAYFQTTVSCVNCHKFVRGRIGR
ncbi:MAG TPA: hypothetical protein VGH33_18060 [Isosphaeraceae bacterium]|jgi:hypothetical protein